VEVEEVEGVSAQKFGVCWKGVIWVRRAVAVVWDIATDQQAKSYFARPGAKKERGFDKLSPNGF
jgi:hypothetical protein